jgi:hypothetical protein
MLVTLVVILFVPIFSLILWMNLTSGHFQDSGACCHVIKYVKNEEVSPYTDKCLVIDCARPSKLGQQVNALLLALSSLDINK